MKRMDSSVQYLRTIDQLGHLSEVEMNTLASMLVEATYQAGETLWVTGEPADCLILIKSGTVRVVQPTETADTTGTQPAAADGAPTDTDMPKKPPLTRQLTGNTFLYGGDFFGVQSMTNLDEAQPPPRRVDGVALGDVVAYKVHMHAKPIATARHPRPTAHGPPQGHVLPCRADKLIADL